MLQYKKQFLFLSQLRLTAGFMGYMQYASNIDRWFEGSVFSPQKGQFAVTFVDITERKRAEDKLKQNQYYLSRAQEIGKIGTWELDTQENILKWTQENYNIFGVESGTDLTYEIFLDCVHPGGNL